MNELVEIKNQLPNEVVLEQKQQQEFKLVGSIVIRRGCKLFAYDAKKDEMKEVEVVKKESVDLKGETVTNKQATYNPKLHYVQAINEKNARRKLTNFFLKKMDIKLT